MQAVTERSGPEMARDPDGSPSIAFGIHLFDERFGALARHPDIVGPAEQLVGNQVYLHAARVNLKQTGGPIIDWHQDFGTYYFIDGMPEPRGLMIAVFLDEVTACNAPLMIIPGSHRHGAVREVTQCEDPHSPCLFRIAPETVTQLAEDGGIEAVLGPAGTAAFMQINIVHGSSVNITPLRRVLLYLIVSAVDNRGDSGKRPEWRASRDYSPLEPLGRDCLLKHQQQ